jgi:hypothetical protein
MIEDVPDDRLERASQSLRNQIEQAIFFAQERNPISFRLDTASAGNLDAAVLDISNSIVQSKIKYIDEIVQTKMQLTEKQVRLDSLVAYLQDNGALGQVSPAARKELCWNAEKVASALRGWRFRETQAGRSEANGSTYGQDLIPQAVASFLDRKRVKRTSDAQENMRLFFKNYVASIGDLFYDLQQVLKRQSDLRDLATKGVMLSETNTILAALFEAAMQYRSAHAATYVLDASVAAEPWTCTESMMLVFHDQFFATVTTLQQLAGDGTGSRAGPADMQMDGEEDASIEAKLTGQLALLAQHLLAASTERIGFLESHNASAATQLKEQYTDLRSRVISNLVKHGKREAAFGLADAYQDFDMLADLVLASEDVRKQSDILAFGSKYGQSFTDVLFGKLVQSGKVSELLAQASELDAAVTAFFAGRDLPNLAWMHYVRIGDFERAATSLAASATEEQGSKGKLMALNLAKMATAASKLSAVDAEADAIIASRDVERLNLQARLAETCESIADEFRIFMEDRVPSHELPASAESRLEKLEAMTFARGPGTNPALAELYRRFLSEMMRGNVLSVEDLVDLLTLRAPPEGEEDDLHFLAALQSIGELYSLVPTNPRRMDSLLSVWRRAVLRNEWV